MATGETPGSEDPQPRPEAEEDWAARRQHPRIAAPAVAVSGDWSIVRDISVGGMSLDQRTPFQPGERHTLVLTDMMLDESKSLQAEVVWCRDGRVGFRWVELDEDQKRWLHQHSDEWQADQELAEEWKSLTTEPGGESLPTVVGRTLKASVPSRAAAPPVYGPSAAFTPPAPRETAKEAGPAKTPQETPRPHPAALPGLSGSPEWLTRAADLLPAALATVTTGMFLGLVCYRIADAGRPAAAAVPAASPASPRPFLGHWSCAREGELLFSETFHPDGTWHRRPATLPDLPEHGHWREKGGVLTTTYLRWDPRTDRERLYRHRHWWSVDGDRGTLIFAVLRPDGSVKEEIEARPAAEQ
jgi:hypothetical protein